MGTSPNGVTARDPNALAVTTRVRRGLLCPQSLLALLWHWTASKPVVHPTSNTRSDGPCRSQHNLKIRSARHICADWNLHAIFCLPGFPVLKDDQLAVCTP